MDKGGLGIDPRGLFHEAYRMDLTPQDCRTIFLDWALGRKEGETEAELRALLDHYGAAQPDHPMTAVLREGLERTERPRGRRGGWRARRTE